MKIFYIAVWYNDEEECCKCYRDEFGLAAKAYQLRREGKTSHASYWKVTFDKDDVTMREVNV